MVATTHDARPAAGPRPCRIVWVRRLPPSDRPRDLYRCQDCRRKLVWVRGILSTGDEPVFPDDPCLAVVLAEALFGWLP